MKLPNYLTSVTKLSLLLLVVALVVLQLTKPDANVFDLFKTALLMVLSFYFGRTNPEPPVIGAGNA